MTAVFLAVGRRPWLARLTACLLVCVACLAVLALGWGVPQALAVGPNDGLAKTTGVLDRATPRRAFDGFMNAYRSADYTRAAHYLDLRGIPLAQQRARGGDIAQALGYVFERKLEVDSGALSDVADGGDKAINATLTIGTIYVDEEPVAVTLTRVRFDDEISRWVISRGTVSMAQDLYTAYGPRGLEQQVPPVLRRLRLFGIEAWQWLAAAAVGLGALLIGSLIASLTTALGRRIARRTKFTWDDLLVEAARAPLRLLLFALLLLLFSQPLGLSRSLAQEITRLGVITLVGGLAWMTLRALSVGTESITSNLPAEQNFKSQGIRTQLAVMERIGTIMVLVISGAIILMQFEFVRNVGVSLLASAGLFGVVFGFAAQKSLAGIVAGLQISLTQPIRIGDKVIIESEFGTIEEINLTYVLVQLWDQRRLIVPIQRFLEQPFQNWTRVGTELLGGANLFVDFETPLEPLREELSRICSVSDKWDGRVCNLQVVGITPQGLEIRALVSAAASDHLWDLRCEIREKMVAYLRDFEGGRYLMKLRVDQRDPPGPRHTLPSLHSP